MPQDRKKSFMSYVSDRIFIDRLTDDQAGKLHKAVYAYQDEGTIPDFKNDDMLQMCFELMKNHFDNDAKKYEERCRKNAENVKKRWNNDRKQSNTSIYNGKQSNTNYTDNDIDNDTDSVSVIDTDTDTVSDTDTDLHISVSADQQAASAAAKAEPPVGDLFTVKQLMSIVTNNKVQLTNEGVRVFHEEMQDSNWMLYGKPVEKKTILRAIRAWSNRHTEYKPENNIIYESDGENTEKKSMNEKKFDLSDTEAVNAWLREEFGEDII